MVVSTPRGNYGEDMRPNPKEDAVIRMGDGEEPYYEPPPMLRLLTYEATSRIGICGARYDSGEYIPRNRGGHMANIDRQRVPGATEAENQARLELRAGKWATRGRKFAFVDADNSHVRLMYVVPASAVRPEAIAHGKVLLPGEPSRQMDASTLRFWQQREVILPDFAVEPELVFDAYHHRDDNFLRRVGDINTMAIL